MTKNNYRLESGQEYSLKQLFNKTNRIEIPDLQRDYCWGDKAWDKEGKNYKELVSGFLDSLITVFNEKPEDKLMLGLIYGYENPHFTIQLCDGQQRLTTLFLLVGMINRKIEQNYLKEILISEAELADDKETNLQYAIRESTLYFLSDLVCEFFLKKDERIADIKKKDWYFKEYDLDASIQSMLKAIEIIDSKLISIDCFAFGKFIVNNLQILYYDMGHRTRGEETFVVINTTGEPLTATENLKPILVGSIIDKEERKIASEEWETREEWFWQNRNDNENVSDDGLNDFYIWYWQIRLLQEKSWKDKKSFSLNPNELFQKKPLVAEDQEESPVLEKWESSKRLETVHNYFLALQSLVILCKEDKISKVLNTISEGKITLSWFRKNVDISLTLPLIAYVQKFGDVNFYQFVRRLRKNHFDKKWKERNKNYIDWRHILQIIEFSNSAEDLLKFETKSKELQFKNISKIDLNEWFSEYEKQKDNLHNDQKLEIEEWEDHQDFMGDLSFFSKSNIDFYTLKNGFDNYVNIIDTIRKKVNKPITNTIRLFLFFIGCEKVEHKPRVSWEIEGVLFSTIGRNHLNNQEFKKLCNQNKDELESYCLEFIKKKIKEWDLFNLDEENFSTEKALKSWLTLKVFYANQKNVCLAYYDGRNSEEGVSVYREPLKKNLLIQSEPFSLANIICGFGVKAGGGGSYVNYTNSEFWLKPHIIDTPFDAIERDEVMRTKEQLEENKSVINSIIASINI